MFLSAMRRKHRTQNFIETVSIPFMGFPGGTRIYSDLHSPGLGRGLIV